MPNELVQKLAIAYAQVKLLRHQEEYPEGSGYSDEIRHFLKWYHFAAIHIPEEDKEIDISTLV